MEWHLPGSFYQNVLLHPKQRKPDITLARKLLKWEPKVELADGLTRTIGYFRTKV